jgi:hypothetical protein
MGRAIRAEFILVRANSPIVSEACYQDVVDYNFLTTANGLKTIYYVLQNLSKRQIPSNCLILPQDHAKHGCRFRIMLTSPAKRLADKRRSCPIGVYERAYRLRGRTSFELCIAGPPHSLRKISAFLIKIGEDEPNPHEHYHISQMGVSNVAKRGVDCTFRGAFKSLSPRHLGPYRCLLKPSIKWAASIQHQWFPIYQDPVQPRIKVTAQSKSTLLFLGDDVC